MPKINLLDEITINKIAAGEVVERPSSIIKELVENSIDAGASNISVEIKNGGKYLIRIIDNGSGIDKDDISKAFLRHATSKISTADDLSSIISLGFRGEALASISAVSKIEMITKTSDALMGTKVIVSGGNVVEKIPVGTNVGTQISVSDLFYNTPARRKFLKTDLSETIAITDYMNKLAIGNPKIRFKYKNNNKTVFETIGDGNLYNAIRIIYGRDVSDNLIELDYNSNYFKISGYIANNNVYRSNKNLQHIFVNGRYIKSSNIMNIINDSYKSIIPINKFSIYFIELEIDPSKIDINIHPNKLDIKFEKEEQLLSELSDYIRGMLLKTSLIGKYKDRYSYSEKSDIELYTDKKQSSTINSFAKDVKVPFDSFSFSPSEQETNEKSSINENTLIKNNKNYNYVENTTDISKHIPTEKSDNTSELENKNINFLDLLKASEMNSPSSANQHLNINEHTQIDFYDGQKDSDFDNLKFVGILFDLYVIFSKNDEMYFLDQHAAHERVQFEKYMKKFRLNEISTQILLEPIILELSPTDTLIASKSLKIFERFGFKVEEYGHRNLSIRGVPNTFGQPESARFIYELIDNLDNLGSVYDTKYDDIAEIACKSAIKANDKLSKQEVDELISQLKVCENPYTCPHGRPVMVKMTKYDIEKMFKRKM